MYQNNQTDGDDFDFGSNDSPSAKNSFGPNNFDQRQQDNANPFIGHREARDYQSNNFAKEREDI